MGRQIEQPGFVEISYEGFEQLYLLSQGYITGGVDEMPEPFAANKTARRTVRLCSADYGGWRWGVVGLTTAERQNAAVTQSLP